MSDRLRNFIQSLPDAEIEHLIVIGREVIAQRKQSKADVAMIALRWTGPGMWAKKVTGYCSAQPSAYGILGDFMAAGQSAHQNGDLIVIGGGATDREIKKSVAQDPWSVIDRSFYALLRVRRGARATIKRGAHEVHGENVELVAESHAQVNTNTAAEVAKHPNLARLAGRSIFPVMAALADVFPDSPPSAAEGGRGGRDRPQGPAAGAGKNERKGRRGPRMVLPGPRGGRQF